MTPSRISICGNPIYEVLTHYEKQITKSRILENLNLRKIIIF